MNEEIELNSLKPSLNPLLTMIDPRIRENLRPDQIRLCLACIKQSTGEGDYSIEEIELVLMGMQIGGPLGRNCPEWRVRALTGIIETGPAWTKTKHTER
mgnify:CR=1 FL=1|jgi:hypothetical protein|tara:strand:- start:170 stop:466 length:297 start_codon:yes stop_codon:yes gene_type:complete